MLTYCISLNAQDLETGADDPFPFPDARICICICICIRFFPDKLTYCISQDLETGADAPFPFPDARSSHCSIYCLLRAPTNPKPNMYIHICGPAPL